MTATRNASDAVKGIEYHEWARRLGIFVFSDGDNPVIQFRPRDADQSASRVDPHRANTVFDQPVNRVAWQSVPVGECGYATIFQVAETALSGGPKRTIAIDTQVVDTALSNSVAGSV